MLVIPTVRTKHSETAFSCYAAQLWNQLLDDIKGASTVASFKSRLETQLFSDAFCELINCSVRYVFHVPFTHFTPLFISHLRITLNYPCV